MAVVPDFMVTFQWTRELARGQRRFVAVQFRITDDEPVLFGHYADDHIEITAAAAVGAILEGGTAQGFEVLIPRGISVSEIMHIREAPRVGWRHLPDNHQQPGRALCPCPFCRTRGSPKEARLRRSLIDRHRPRGDLVSSERIASLAAAISTASELGEPEIVRELWRELDKTYTEATSDSDRVLAAEALLDAWHAWRWTRGGDPAAALHRLADGWEARGGDLLALAWRARRMLVWAQLDDDDFDGQVAALTDIFNAIVASDDPSLQELADEILDALDDVEEERAEAQAAASDHLDPDAADPAVRRGSRAPPVA